MIKIANNLRDLMLKQAADEKPGLWANIRAKKRKGQAPADPGDKDYPDSEQWEDLTKESSIKLANNLIKLLQYKQAAGPDLLLQPKPVEYSQRQLDLRKQYPDLFKGTPEGVLGTPALPNRNAIMSTLGRGSGTTGADGTATSYMDSSETLTNGKPTSKIESSEPKVWPSDQANAVAEFYGDPSYFMPRGTGDVQDPFIGVNAHTTLNDDAITEEATPGGWSSYKQKPTGFTNGGGTVPRFMNWTPTYDAPAAPAAPKPIPPLAQSAKSSSVATTAADPGDKEASTSLLTAKLLKLAESAAWQTSEGKNPEGGLNRKGVASYRAENPGSKLQMAVTTDPSKLDPDSKAAKRRKSFCARMGGMPGPMQDEKGRPTRKALSLSKWNC